MLHRPLAAAALLLLSVAGPSRATAQLPVQSYTMRNGGTGTFAYRDAGYSAGTGQSTTNALLQGGLGKLTDGVIATQNWYSVPSAYVGWSGYSGHAVGVPTITFLFGQSYSFTRLRLWVDDADGFGGVYAPTGVTVGGTPDQTWTSMTGGTFYAVSDPAGPAPFMIDLDISGQGLSGNSLSFRLHRLGDYQWAMLSEVAVDGTPTNVVPEPGTIALLGTGLLGLVVARRRRR